MFKSVTRTYLQKARKILRQISIQIILVFLAFAIMVITSYLYVSGLERDHLRRQTENTLAYTHANITAALIEPEATLNTLTQTIKVMIAAGESFEIIKNYLNQITVSLTNDDRFLTHITDVYGIFDIFGGTFYSGTGSALPDDFTLDDTVWYKTAIEANGRIVVTKPRIDKEAGTVTITYAHRIFDNDGAPLAVLCIDAMLDRINQYVVNTQVTEGSYGILIDHDFNVLAHPHPGYLGLSVRQMNDGETIIDELLQGKNISERKATDYRGFSSILFVERLSNGWYMAILAYENRYYQSVFYIAFLLSAIGFLMAIVLNVALFRLAMAKNEADERMQIMFNSSPMGASFWDENLNLIDCNNEIAKLFDLPNKQVLFDKFFDLSPENQPDGSVSKTKILEILGRALNEDTYQYDWIHQKLNGEQIPSKIIFIRARYKGKYCITAYIKDLREQQAMLREMHKAETAEESNKMKSKFLATMSHEIRTPMNAILGITEIQMQNKALPKDTHEALDYIHTSGYMLLGIINDILDLSKVDAGKLELILAKYKIASIIQDTVQLNTMRVGSKRINFMLHVDPFTPAEMIGDELRIKQILNNLLTNAMKYTESGEVVLSVSAEAKALPNATPPEEDNQNKGDMTTLIFRIRDTGQGMTEEQLSLIFNEYTRFNTQTHRLIQGTGLGLSITKRLVDMMNGEILVESVPDKGSTFTIHLPQKVIGSEILGADTAKNLQQFNFHNLPQMKTSQIVRQPMPYGRVMIVDDVETNLYVAKGLLAPYELSIDTAGGGHDAINKIKAGNIYDIVFMDHMMPVMDGIEATRKIRELGYTQPIVALTANAVTGQAEEFLMNGFDDYISKPIDIRQLNLLLNRLVRDKQPPEVLEAVNNGTLKNPAAEEASANTLDPELARTFIRDAQKALETLTTIYEKHDAFEDDDIHLYTVTTHAMKSALANVGEANLSKVAKRLEEAGREKNTEVITSDTPAFLDDLKAVITKITPKDDDEGGKAEDEDLDYLQEQLLVFRAACTVYDKKAAKEVIIELKKSKWSRPTKEMINLLAEHLLHSEFEEASNIARDFEVTPGS